MRTHALVLALSLLAVLQPVLANQVPATAQVTSEALPPSPASPALDRLFDAPVLTDAQKQRLAVFHGRPERITDINQLPPGWQAIHDAQRGILSAQLDTQQPGVAYWQASAALQHGDLALADALAVRVQPAQDPTVSQAQADLLLARIDDLAGRFGQAVTRLRPLRDRFLHDTQGSPAELTAGAQALTMLARLEGRPSADYQTAVSLLGQAQSQDPLHWPAKLAEAWNLYDKGNREQAAEAALETLSLHDANASAWLLLGRLWVDSFDFEKSSEAANRIDAITPNHPFAVELRIRALLRQNDPTAALAQLAPLLAQHPRSPTMLAWQAAIAARAFDEPALAQAYRAFDEVTPNSPLALALVGEVLSEARQYQRSDEALRLAIARQPNDAAPRLERGLMLMQWGDLDAAREELANAVRLDPFHRRASNSLSLVEQMLDWPVIETEHFIIRHAPGVDAVLAADMPEYLEAMRREVTANFNHEPTHKTQIDLLPDEAAFAVRITGEAEIWTIAACTGDTIAMTPPRLGAGQAGGYDWLNVLRHEFVHTVTLSQTNNRIPHWFTEAAAVSEEMTGRSYDACLLLATALHDDALFAYEDINWGFIRPRKPTDRALAYAQANWMFDYLIERFGRSSIHALLEKYRTGISDAEALRQVTQLETHVFMRDFQAWAIEQVKTWGLDRRPVSEEVRAVLLEKEPIVTLEQVDQWLVEFPGHPELLRLRAVVMLLTPDTEAKLAALEAYAQARPVDPWPLRERARIAIDAGEPQSALDAIATLDRQEGMSPDFAKALVSLHRQAGRLDDAARAADRALHRDPFNATLRELAAAVELQRGDKQRALRHVEALTVLEPDRPIHTQRLEALRKALAG